MNITSLLVYKETNIVDKILKALKIQVRIMDGLKVIGRKMKEINGN